MVLIQWDPELQLLEQIKAQMKEMGFIPSKETYYSLLRQIKKADKDFEIQYEDVRFGTGDMIGIEAAAVWFVQKMMDTPDGIAELLPIDKGSNARSMLYNTALETMRTSRGTFFSAEEIRERLRIPIGDKARRQLRQLRRLLSRVCKENGGSVKQISGNRTRFGFR